MKVTLMEPEEMDELLESRLIQNFDLAPWQLNDVNGTVSVAEQSYCDLCSQGLDRRDETVVCIELYRDEGDITRICGRCLTGMMAFFLRWKED